MGNNENETRRRSQSIDAIIMLRKEAGKMTRHRDDNDQFKLNFKHTDRFK